MKERLNSAPFGYLCITNQGVITEINETFCNMVGHTFEELLNTHIESIMSIANKLLFHTYFYPFLQLNGHVEEMYLSLKDHEGKDVPLLLNAKSFKQDDVEGVDCVFMQMGKRIDYEQQIRSAKKQAEEALREKNQALDKLEQLHKEIETKQSLLMELNTKLEKLSVTDSLTGLKNRRFFMERLEEHIVLFQKNNLPFSLLIIDIDFFKKVNDTWGHLIGDRVLIKLAEILNSTFKVEDIVARYGGEEFVVLLPDANKEKAKEKAEEFRRAVQSAEWKIDQIVTVSIGVATIQNGDSDMLIISNADQALYTSKENGRNRVTHIEDILERLR
ncbi:chemotaxis protein CheY [Bacillus sp. FJAT-22090]|uniref:sensor domain-containing diguanylate cyclase n=1 Tax=Bacillus sp. FJAT-22090 TaxID=1581038 RepID=UPI0006AF8C04|nr:diguanylate cyclase [Bacillus sp. FJAT-22090]ALC87206.1 chemotaxis protein CheY [Bacillus sp. FJAT-22090]